MKDIMENIKERRSIRKYEDKNVSDEIIKQLLEAVKWTPSWNNTQCWEVIIVKDRAIKENLQQTITKGNPATKSIVEAPVILALCGKLNSSGYFNNKAATKFGDWFMFDIALATQNICLVAHRLGLGTVIVGLLDHDRASEVLKVRAGYELVVLIPLGYPAKIPSAPKRRNIEDFTHYDIF